MLFNCHLLFQHREDEEDAGVVRPEQQQQQRDQIPLDPARHQGSLGRRRPQGRPDGHRPGQDEVLEAHLQVRTPTEPGLLNKN
jgi:hypothetical protein